MFYLAQVKLTRINDWIDQLGVCINVKCLKFESLLAFTVAVHKWLIKKEMQSMVFFILNFLPLATCLSFFFFYLIYYFRLAGTPCCWDVWTCMWFGTDPATSGVAPFIITTQVEDAAGQLLSRGQRDKCWLVTNGLFHAGCYFIAHILRAPTWAQVWLITSGSIVSQDQQASQSKQVKRKVRRKWAKRLCWGSWFGEFTSRWGS